MLADFASSDEAQWGVVPRACQLLFDALGDSSASSPVVVQVSYLEVYNDRLQDLRGGRVTHGGPTFSTRSHTVDPLSPLSPSHGLFRGQTRLA